MGDEDICGRSGKPGRTDECQLRSGWGTDHLGEGACKFHGGNTGNQDKGAKEENTNAVSHGLFTKKNKFYQKVMDDDLRQLCDAIFAGYVEEYGFRHGEPHEGHKTRLREIAVNHIKILYSDNWAYDRPEELESGNPMVDKELELKVTDNGVIDQDSYKPSVVTSTQQELRREDRQWLKAYGLLDDPEQQKADAQSDIAEAWREALEAVDED